MADLIVAFVLIVIAGLAAELVRTVCRRQLLHPIPIRRAPQPGPLDEGSTLRLGDHVGVG